MSGELEMTLAGVCFPEQLKPILKKQIKVSISNG